VLQLHKITEKARLLISMGLAFFLLLILFVQSKGLVEGGQDSYNHYLISKYAFKYPYLLLDQWGKPVYTILAHPFCWFGLKVGVWLNIISTLVAALLGSLSAKKLGIQNYWLTFWIIVFTPISLGNTLSTLTEPLNMLWLSAGFYLWLSEKRVSATILFSFLPWIRTEGFVIIVPFFVFLIIKKYYKLIPLLLSASFLFNILGWWQTGEPLWIISDNPYFRVEADAERFSPGPGSFIYYMKANSKVFGNIIGILGVAGALLIGYQFIVKRKQELSFLFWVICGVFVAYYFAHSFIMWKGMMGTHGMLRVMMVIVPCLAICFNYLISFLSKNIRGQNQSIIFALLCLLLAFNTFNTYKSVGYPTHFWNLEKSSVRQISNFSNMVKAQSFIDSAGLNSRVIYHQIPIYNVMYNKDPFAKPLTENWVTEDVWSIDHKDNWAPKGSVLIWDGYHAQREGNLKYKEIINMNDYLLLKSIRNSDTAILHSDILIFEKVN